MKKILLLLLLATSYLATAQQWKWAKKLGIYNDNIYNLNIRYKRIKPIVFNDTLVYIRPKVVLDDLELVWLEANTGNEIKSRPLAKIKYSFDPLLSNGFEVTDFKRDSEGSFYVCLKYKRHTLTDSVYFGTNPMFIPKTYDFGYFLKFKKSGQIEYFKLSHGFNESVDKLDLTIDKKDNIYIYLMAIIAD